MRNVAIVGAGFGGLHVARRLVALAGCKRVKVTIIDRQASHTLRPKLAEAVGGRIACAVQVPLKPLIAEWRQAGADVEFVQAQVVGVDSGNRQVVTDKGAFPFWRLVVATGSTSAAAPMAGGELTLPVWRFADACNVRRRAEFGVHMAKLGNGMHWLNHVVIGGGFVGVEVAADDWGLIAACGRIPVKVTLQALQSPAIYALGDAAHIVDWGGSTEPSAHEALLQGAIVARNITAELQGCKPAAYRRSRPVYAVATGPWQGVLVWPGLRPCASPLTPLAKQLAIARHLWHLGGVKLLRAALPDTIAATCRASAWDCPPLENGCLHC